MQVTQFDADCRPSRVPTFKYVHGCSLIKTSLLSGYIPSVCKLELGKRTTMLFVG